MVSLCGLLTLKSECVNEKPLAEEGGKKRKKVLDISILDHNYLVMLPI